MAPDVLCPAGLHGEGGGGVLLGHGLCLDPRLPPAGAAQPVKEKV